MAITTAKEWRKKTSEGVELEFPDYGNIARIRPLDAEYFFTEGKIPDFVGDAVRTILHGGDRKMPMPADDAPQETTEEWLAWLNRLVCFAFVEPKVVMGTPKDNELSVDDISYADKIFLYHWFGAPAQVLRSFRDKQKQFVEAVAVAKANGNHAQQALKSAPVGVSDAGNAG